MRYMLIERFVRGARTVYERAATAGRMLPPGVRYIDSWVSERLDTCFQLVDADDPRLLTKWMESWRDLVTFEDVIPVITSAEAASRTLGSDARFELGAPKMDAQRSAQRMVRRGSA